MIKTLTIAIDIITLVVQFLILFQYIKTEKELKRIRRKLAKNPPWNLERI